MKIFYKRLKDKIGANWIFLIIILIIFSIVAVFDFTKIEGILNYFFKTLYNLLPILAVVYVIIFVFSLLLANKKLIKFLEHGSYFKKMFLSIITGIISSGPIYIWYGFLKKLHSSGLSLGHISGFSYARAIKLPLFPMMILYFGIKFTIIFSVVLFLLSFVQCFLIDRAAPLLIKEQKK